MQEGINQPRLRVNRSASLTLSNTWQDVVFNGTSAFNVNTFGNDPVSNVPVVMYSATNNLFRFYEQYDKNMEATLYVRTASTMVTTGLLLQYRIVVPNGSGAGQDLYFPFPDADGLADIGSVGIKVGNINHNEVPIALYIGQPIRANGFKVQMRLSETILGIGNIQVTYAAMLIRE